jgi:hypothetical protein
MSCVLFADGENKSVKRPGDVLGDVEESQGAFFNPV